jgi:type 1 glutamine amidotransferase
VATLTTLLLVGGPPYHNQPFHYAELAGILAGEGGADLRITRDLEVLTPATLTQYRVVVNWTTFVEPTDEQVQALVEAVESGIGFLGLHAASATFWNNARYLHMLGSRFIGHDPYKTFTVSIEDRAHPITQGVEDFQIADELYHLSGGAAEFEALAAAVRRGLPFQAAIEAANAAGQAPLGPDVHVLASAEGHPVLYVKMFGKGRVHYNALGHDRGALANPHFRRLLVQGLRWVAGET